LQLAQIVANSSPDYQNGGTANRQSIDWDAAYAEAAKVFSPGQIQGLKAQADLDKVESLVQQYYKQTGVNK